MVDFPGYFTGMEAKLQADLAAIRAVTTHAGNKGSKAEDAFRSFLNDHLPRSMEVGQGEVIDQERNSAGSKGGGEHQVDVLILSDAHPRFGRIEEPNTYFIEGVQAGGEVKASLQMGQVEAAFKQAVAFKRLKPMMRAGDMVYSNDSDSPRYVERRPYFLFAYESAVKMDALIARLLSLEASHGVGGTDHFDAIFLLEQGSAFNVGDGRGVFAMLADDDQSKVERWGFKKGDTLLPLIGWLSVVMPVVVRVQSITTPYLLSHIPVPGALS